MHISTLEGKSHVCSVVFHRLKQRHSCTTKQIEPPALSKPSSAHWLHPPFLRAVPRSLELVEASNDRFNIWFYCQLPLKKGELQKSSRSSCDATSMRVHPYLYYDYTAMSMSMSQCFGCLGWQITLAQWEEWSKNLYKQKRWSVASAGDSLLSCTNQESSWTCGWKLFGMWATGKSKTSCRSAEFGAFTSAYNWHSSLLLLAANYFLPVFKPAKALEMLAPRGWQIHETLTNWMWDFRMNIIAMWPFAVQEVSGQAK